MKGDRRMSCVRVLSRLLAWTIMLWLPALCQGQERGTPAPDFSYTGMDGKEYCLSDHRGKIVVIDFFSCWWLASCNNITHVETVHRKYADKGVFVLGLARDGLTRLEQFVDERPLDVTYTVGVSQQADRAFGVGYIPHMYIIDPLGRIFWHGEPRGGPDSLYKLWLRLDWALDELVDMWPQMEKEAACEELDHACTRIEEAGTPCELHEGYTLLKKVQARFASLLDIQQKSGDVLKRLEKEKADALAEGGKVYTRLSMAAKEIEQQVMEGGSIFALETAEKCMAKLNEIAEKAGARSHLAERIETFVNHLAQSYEGPGFLGVSFDNGFEGRGAALARVHQGTAAAKHGLRAGDVIVDMDGRAVTGSEDAHAVLEGYTPGRTLVIGVRRADSDKLEKITVVLGRRVR